MADESAPTQMSGGEGWIPPSVERLQEVMPQYEVLEMLGRGGMGAVYKARQKSLKRLVAIKVLPLGVANDEFKFAERFRQEAETLAQMNHPAIVNVYDFGETPDGLLFFVMEFVNGTDVQKMIQASGRLPEEHALAIAAHVCDALHYAHTHGVIHRDIKPANILINQEGHVKVADFGLAKMQDSSQTSGLTLTNMTMGTPDYAAPEVFQPGAAVDHRADLYAVGVMLYQMLTGAVPRGMFKLPSQRAGGTDPRFDAIIVKAMDANRDERYQSASEVRQALDEILTTPLAKDEGTGAISARSLPQPSRVAPAPEPAAKASPGKAKYLAIATVVAVLGMAGFFVMSGKRKPGNEAAASSVREVSGAGKVDAGVSSPAQQKSATEVGAWVDQLSTTAWHKRWSFKDGVLTPLDDGAYQEFDQAQDTALRVKVRPAPGAPPSPAKRPALQASLRQGPVNGQPQRRGSYQFQAYVPGRSCALVYLEEDAGTRANPAPPEYLLKSLMLPEDLLGKPEIEWEFRAIGAELTIWADGQLVGSARDSRLPSGSTRLTANPGVEIVGVQTARITTVPPAAPANPASSAVTQSNSSQSATTIDWLKTDIWRAPWVLEQGVLKSTAKSALKPLGTIGDGTIRVRLRDVDTPATSSAPALQIIARYTPLATGKSGHYLFQVFPQRSTCNLIYLEKNTTSGAETTETLWKDKRLPAAPGGGKEIEFEIRTEGDSLSAWAAGQSVASIRDARLSTGGASIISDPTVEITRLETVGVKNSKLVAAPVVDAPLPAIANWQDVTTALREKARVIPELVVETDRIRHSGQGGSPRIPLTRDDIRDGAVRIRFTGDGQVNLRANAGGFIFVLCQRTQTIFQRYDKGAINPTVLRPSVVHPAGYDSTQTHELLVTMQGTTIRAWLDGRFIGEAQENTFQEGTADIAFTKWSVVQKVEIADLAGASTATDGWTDWLGPTIASGKLPTSGWKIDGDGVTTDRTIDGANVLPGEMRDAAVRVSYDLRDSDGIQITMRERNPGQSAREVYFADDTGASLFLERMSPGGVITKLSQQRYPAGTPHSGPRTLEFRCVGDRIEATVTGATSEPITLSATDPALTTGPCAVVLKKGALLKKVETLRFSPAPSPGAK